MSSEQDHAEREKKSRERRIEKTFINSVLYGKGRWKLICQPFASSTLCLENKSNWPRRSWTCSFPPINKKIYFRCNEKEKKRKKVNETKLPCLSKHFRGTRLKSLDLLNRTYRCPSCIGRRRFDWGLGTARFLMSDRSVNNGPILVVLWQNNMHQMSSDLTKEIFHFFARLCRDKVRQHVALFGKPLMFLPFDCS